MAIDPERQLFNGAPAFVARLIDALGLRPGARVLHIGAGLGYYSAIIGHVVGATGSVVALEIDEALGGTRAVEHGGDAVGECPVRGLARLARRSPKGGGGHSTRFWCTPVSRIRLTHGSTRSPLEVASYCR